MEALADLTIMPAMHFPLCVLQHMNVLMNIISICSTVSNFSISTATLTYVTDQHEYNYHYDCYMDALQCPPPTLAELSPQRAVMMNLMIWHQLL